MVILLTNMVLSGSHRLNQVPNVIDGSGEGFLGIDDEGFTRMCGNYVVEGSDMVCLIGKMRGIGREVGVLVEGKG